MSENSEISSEGSAFHVSLPKEQCRYLKETLVNYKDSIGGFLHPLRRNKYFRSNLLNCP
jgi:hypothetical protein